MMIPGATISHYRIVERLGAGGMGVVYRAVDVKLDRTVAIKFLPSNLVADERARARFIAEAKAASALDYPNIGTIYEIDEAPDSGLFIVMAYYAGDSLETRLRHGRLTAAEAVGIAIQVGEGLACAHYHGIIHRDIKPSNLILTAGGVVKIVDFGLAKVANLNLTDAGLTLGTPAFMAPEQTAGLAVDHRCDLWSLGVVLYYMLSGRLPFSGKTTAEILDAIRDREPPPLDAPSDLQAIVAHALAKRLRDRYSSARALVSDLRATASGAAAAAGPAEVRAIDLVVGSNDPTVEMRRSTLAPRTAGELRQLTVASCELMDFPALAEQLDPEHVRDVLLSFRKVCEDSIQPLDGHVAQYHDADLTLHFGVPEAHEDDAPRAVRAALAIVGEMPALHRDLVRRIPVLARFSLYARVGVHTGPVVVDADSGESAPVVIVGMTGTLAGKIRDIGSASDVLVSEETRKLIRRVFRAAPLGLTRLTGISKAISVYRIEGASPESDSAYPSEQDGLTELVGRSRELGLLVDRWEEVKDGTGQVVLLGGEAGVGKSRLVGALRSAVINEPHRQIECRCSPYHRNSPLWPVLDLLGRLFELDRSLDTAEKLARIRARLADVGLGSTENVYLLALLLSVPVSEVESHPSLSPQRAKEQTLALLLKLLLPRSSKTPVLLIVEDLHWVDPTTLELLGLLVDQGPTAPLLTILTFRPEFVSPWGHRAHLTQLTVARLSKRDAERMVEKVSGGKRLPADVLVQIVNNSDGVPLFIEELTKSLLESEALEETPEGFEVRTSFLRPAIPSTLKDSLTARLDRLGSAKEVAQMASVVGRSFSYEWLLAMSPLGEQLLRHDLARLVDAGLLYQQGLPPEATYTFKHALIKDAAYQGLLKPMRQQHHARLARGIAERFRDVVETQPELLAHHYAEAGLTEHALSYWRKAGQRAALRSGNDEATVHFSRALDLVRTLPASAEHTQQELEVLIALGSVQLATKGYAAPAVRDVYTQARDLSERAGESRSLFDALQGLVNYYLVHSELSLALAQSERLVDLAGRLGDANLSFEASLRLGVSLYVMGSPVDARPHLETVAAIGAVGANLPDRIVYGQDPVVSARCHLTVVDWLLGLVDESVADIDAALTRGRDLNHPFTLAWALLYKGILHSLRAEPTEVLQPMDALATLCEEQGFAYRAAQTVILRGWALAHTMRDDAAINQIVAGIARARATGAEAYRPYYAALLGDACLSLGHVPRGLDAVEEALDLVTKTNERFLEAELHRLRGELILASSRSRDDEAEACYEKALKIARAQGARSLVLRAALSRARIDSGDREPRRTLAAVTSEFDLRVVTPDLVAARALLARD